MTHRTDWPELTDELQRQHGFDDEAALSIQTALRDAFTAGAEANPWRGDMNGAVMLLQLMTDRAPPPPGRRHCLMLNDGVLLMAIAIPFTHPDGGEGAFLSFRIDGKGDLDRSPDDLAGAIMTLMPKAIAALSGGDNAIIPEAPKGDAPAEPGKPSEGAVVPRDEAGTVRPDSHTTAAPSQSDWGPPPDPALDPVEELRKRIEGENVQPAQDWTDPTHPAQTRGGALLYDIAISCASFIAAIDNSSARVAEYLARRLLPMAYHVPYEVLNQIAADDRQPAPPGSKP